MNNVAQVVEAVFSVKKIMEHLDHLIDKGIKPETVKVTPKEGTGAGAVDVPRGILFHEYTYDKKGICVAADCVIPTGQNHLNIQKDFEKFVPEFMGKGEKELGFLMEMLVRAYDPCISCSTHFLNVEFVR